MTNNRVPPETSGTNLVDEGEFEFHGEAGHLVRRLHQIAVSIFLDLTKDFDLTPVQYATLNAVEEHPGYEQRQIATLIAVDRTTINNITARLEARGLIVRERVGRRFDLWITDEGRVLRQGVSPKTALHADLLLAPLAPKQRRDFIHLLQQVVDGNNSASRVPLKKSVRRKLSF